MGTAKASKLSWGCRALCASPGCWVSDCLIDMDSGGCCHVFITLTLCMLFAWCFCNVTCCLIVLLVVLPC
jgi:hypothetical protein